MTDFTVAIPAKNEERLIERALSAIVEQENVPAGGFDVIVLANDCTDGTAARARAFADTHPLARIEVIETVLPAERAHIGTARRLVMDAAAQRFERRGVSGIIASTDADTVVDRCWVANTIAAMGEVDAVAGRIEILREDWDVLPNALQNAYERDGRYYRMVALLEATLDPLAWDPAPRHADHFGGSFAVSAAAYRRVGGVPLVDRLEDVALYHALLRADLRVRHALDVRVRTSGRRHGRVVGGFATHLEDLATLGDWFVEDPRTTIGIVRVRAALRKLWRNADDRSALRAIEDFGMPARDLHGLLERGAPFGENWHRLERALREARARDPLVQVAFAQESLRRAIAAANASRPTRTRAASGAG